MDKNSVSLGHEPITESERGPALQLAREGVDVPMTRCYWVVESVLLGGAYPSTADPSLRRSRIDSLWRAGIRTFVNLVEEDERSPSGATLAPYDSYVAELSAACGERAKCLRFPIRDLSVPTAAAMETILNVIDLSLEANLPVFVHCMGGVGRTGTVVGCWLRRDRFAGREDVIAVLAKLRQADVARADRPAPETRGQREMVLTWNA